MFKHFATSLESQHLFVYIFWFIHCKFFQVHRPRELLTELIPFCTLSLDPLPKDRSGRPSVYILCSCFSSQRCVRLCKMDTVHPHRPTYDKQEDSRKEQAHLLRSVSNRYVGVLGTDGMEDYKDFFFKHYPFLVANAVIWGFHYLCPGSRHLYSNAFKRVLYLQCARILSGIEVGESGTTSMRRAGPRPIGRILGAPLQSSQSVTLIHATGLFVRSSRDDTIASHFRSAKPTS